MGTRNMKTNEQKQALLNHSEIVNMFSYDAAIGRLRWEIKKRGIVIGDIAGGSDGANGYRTVKINYQKYGEHRLVWFFHNGAWPTAQIDHINGVRDDNRIENLREVTSGQNAQNIRAPQKNGRSGYLGVAWRGALGKWRALIQVNGKRKELGCFDDPREAHAAYISAKRALHPYNTI